MQNKRFSFITRNEDTFERHSKRVFTLAWVIVALSFLVVVGFFGFIVWFLVDPTIILRLFGG